MKAFGWSISEVTLTFSIAILVLGFAAFLGGLWMRCVGPRTVGIVAGICYGLGVALSGLSAGRLWVLYLSYGVLGGLGLGLGYIVPVATLVKWFPEVAAKDYTLQQALSTWQWYALWAILFLNVTAGISIISQAAPMAAEISGVPPLVAATMVGIISIANGAGRLLWAWLSDALGRPKVFLIMFLLQAALFSLLPAQRDFAMLVTAAFVILSCYGGAFGTMPAFAADYFGPKFVGSIYGLIC